MIAATVDVHAEIATTQLPSDLGPEGRRVWTTATTGRSFTPAELLMLASACQFADLAGSARATVAREGPTTTSRYHGARPHPAAQLAIRYAGECRRLLSRLRVWT